MAQLMDGDGLSVEQRICEIFGEVLGVTQVAADDDFFELGGHSLLAGRLAAKIRQEMGVRLRLADFVDSPTPQHVAALVELAASGQPSLP